MLVANLNAVFVNLKYLLINLISLSGFIVSIEYASAIEIIWYYNKKKTRRL